MHTTSHRPHRRILILGSGTGSNANAIIEHAARHPSCSYRVVGIVTTAASAGITDVGLKAGLPVEVLDKAMPTDSQREALLDMIDRLQVDLVVLAGYMRYLDPAIIERVAGQVVNIHPSLLPAHGGQGMYGMRVHRAVLEAGDVESGATVHWVNHIYDDGAIIGQERVPVMPTDTAETLAARVRVAEHRLFPAVLERICASTPAGA